MTQTVERNIAYFPNDQITDILQEYDTPELIAEAYLELYDPDSPPQKFFIANSDGSSSVIMPYRNSADNLSITKVLAIDPGRRPGVSGYITVYDESQRQVQAVLEAGTLTAIRTAAKSLLFSRIVYSNTGLPSPALILIFGSSTQAIHHALMFAGYFVSAAICIVARSTESAERAKSLVGNEFPNIKLVTGPENLSEQPDIIITTTASPLPVVTEEQARTAKIIIAVGSSAGNRTEIPMDAVLGSDRFVDAHVSVMGKGEYAMPVSSGLLTLQQIKELRDLLRFGNGSFNPDLWPKLFVSKGLIIEDYSLVKKIVQRAK